MAAPIQLKANTPGGNSYKKSASAQKPYHGKPAPKATKPKVRVDKGKAVGGAGVKPAYNASKAVTRPNVKGIGQRVSDYSAVWMQSHGLKNAQNAGKVGRLPYATVPADGIGTGTGSLKRSSAVSHTPKPAKRTTSKSSSATTKARVKTTYTGKAFKVAKRPKTIKSK